mmetsp:Transcript_11700/g.25740  ORF Transcript_11700/g.25740 Transcript_11700/m.25740 type:complete len:267 (-) Transcript_11700:1180-1980(-)
MKNIPQASCTEFINNQHGGPQFPNVISNMETRAREKLPQLSQTSNRAASSLSVFMMKLSKPLLINIAMTIISRKSSTKDQTKMLALDSIDFTMRCKESKKSMFFAHRRIRSNRTNRATLASLKTVGLTSCKVLKNWSISQISTMKRSKMFHKMDSQKNLFRSTNNFTKTSDINMTPNTISAASKKSPMPGQTCSLGSAPWTPRLDAASKPSYCCCRAKTTVFNAMMMPMISSITLPVIANFACFLLGKLSQQPCISPSAVGVKSSG